MVSGQGHPSRTLKTDAEAMTIPHICLPSPTDSPEEIKGYVEVFNQPGRIGEIETYHTMFHGWMGGRANFQNAENTKEFERA